MPYRGWLVLNGQEIANSSRVISHIRAEPPVNDLGMQGDFGDCGLTPIAEDRPLLFQVPATSTTIAPDRPLLFTPPDGSRLYGPALLEVGDCWDDETLCGNCRTSIEYDDSWTELPDFLGDTFYRPELAPWYTTRIPESAEFGGIWMMDVKGLDIAPTSREIVDMAGDGAAAGPHRFGARTVSFDALLVACTNAGLTYGLRWLNAQLNDTNDRTDSVLRYLDAHPGHSAADPATLVREVHGVVLTRGGEPTDLKTGGGKPNSQATMARVSFELTVTHPFAYSPPINFPVEWDDITVEPVQWVHAADCKQPQSCDPMPTLFSTECEVERIEIVSTPPPVCGGCMPVCGVQSRSFFVPGFEYPLRARKTAVSMTIHNTGEDSLTFKAYWRRCNTNDKCQDEQWPVQIVGLPSTASLTLDGINGRYWADYDGRRRRQWGIVSTPTGAPWVPAIIDRSECWEFVVLSAAPMDFEISMSLSDREA